MNITYKCNDGMYMRWAYILNYIETWKSIEKKSGFMKYHKICGYN